MDEYAEILALAKVNNYLCRYADYFLPYGKEQKSNPKNFVINEKPKCKSCQYCIRQLDKKKRVLHFCNIKKILVQPEQNACEVML